MWEPDGEAAPASGPIAQTEGSRGHDQAWPCGLPKLCSHGWLLPPDFLAGWSLGKGRGGPWQPSVEQPELPKELCFGHVRLCSPGWRTVLLCQPAHPGAGLRPGPPAWLCLGTSLSWMRKRRRRSVVGGQQPWEAVACCIDTATKRLVP